MDIENWQKIKEVFNTAVELPAAERESFLCSRTELDSAELADLRRLLAADEKGYFEQPLINLNTLWDDESGGSFVGSQLGEYEILEEVGRGGIGIVYKAVRETDEFVQTAALKILKKGMDSAAMLRRFRLERRILASLEHPNIARLLDGGTTSDGVSYLAMEYVEGEPLDEYCRENDLSIAERLRLFEQICLAVSFAHSKLVVHRDLKPSNILIARDGTVKLLDFGIAKILQPQENGARQTVTTLGMMTPQYASPEQIRGEMVSTASDVYSLGLILYELLTGVSAYQVPGSSPAEIARIICESEPVRPSEATARSSIKKATAENKTAMNRLNGQPPTPKYRAGNPKSLRGDLDNIILRALCKEPARRYASVEQLAADVKRHLDGLPVTARPDTFAYRFEKFVTRHRVPVIAALLIALSLVAGIAAASWQAVRAERQRALAERRFGEVRELANNGVFKYYDQIKDLQGATAARETLLKDAVIYLDRLAADAHGEDPSLQKDLVNAYFRLGDIFGAPHESANTGNTRAALESYQKAQTLCENLTAQNPDDWESRGKLRAIHTKTGEVYQRLGNSEETRKHLKTACDLSEQIAAHEPNSPKQLSALGQSYILYGETLPLGDGENQSVAISSKGFPYLDKALQIAPEDSPSLQRSNMARVRVGLQYSALARDAEEAGDKAQAAAYFARALDYYRRGKQQAQRLLTQDAENAGFRRRVYVSEFNESTALSGLGNFDEALPIQKKMLAEMDSVAKDKKNAEAQFDLAQTFYEIGNTYFRLGDYQAAAENIRRAVDIYNRINLTDAGNFEAQKNCFEAQLKMSSIESAEKKYAAALTTIRNASEKLRIAATDKSEYALFAEGLSAEKMGDLAAAQNDATDSRIQYQKALSIWQQQSQAPENIGFSLAKINYLRSKLAAVK